MIEMEFNIRESRLPLLALAIHNGHAIDPEVEPYLVPDEFMRLKEEDPLTGFFARISPNFMIVNTSRFQTDLNRPREDALYRSPEQAWGMEVWKKDTPQKVMLKLLQDYDYFYRQLDRCVKRLIRAHGYLVVFDFHSYNHRRSVDGTQADPTENPEINIGTGTLNRELWAPVVDYFQNCLHGHGYMGRKLDVRENIKFKGGHLSAWIHEHYSDRSCVLAIEVKKNFMDEHTGAINILHLRELKKAFEAIVPGVLQVAEKIGASKFSNQITG